VTSSPDIWDVRAFVYERFAETARAPTLTDVAARFSIATDAAAAIFAELDRQHAFFLEPGTTTIRIANPFSAVPTDFVVRARGRDYYANCAWDALGIPAALDADAEIAAACAATGEPLPLRIERGRLVGIDAVAHFVVPFDAWYDDMVFT